MKNKIKIIIVFGVVIATLTTPVYALSLAYDGIVRQNAARFGFDPLLVHAQIQTESGHVATASNACCSGLMQLHRSYFKGNLYDPQSNINQGTAYVRQLLGQFNNNLVNALRAYNWGPGNMRAFLKGNKRFMPRETIEYTKKIEKYYIQYGGKGSYFNGQAYKVNPNSKIANEQLSSDRVCKPMKLPVQANVDTSTLPTIPPITMPAGAGERTVFDPTKATKNAEMIQQLFEQIKVLRGEYDALTKGAAGFGLLSNVTQLAGYELPTTINAGQDSGGAIYKTLKEQRAADTGVYDSPALKASFSQNAKISNNAYVEAEMGWTQIMCSLNNVKALDDVNTNTVKQSKDVGNRIGIERALLEANASKIRSALVMLNAAQSNYSVTMRQEIAKYTAKR